MPLRLNELAAALDDRYTVEEQVGRGGMATVFRALDKKHGRTVAIKVLHPELAVALGSDRFLREIQIAARLSHPHILALHDSGEAGHYLYYVMPFVEGESLRDRLDRETSLPVEDAVRVAREVASALDYAHSRGVVHRDIKPENILLSGGFAIVADFGIAKAVDAAGPAVTQTGLGIGSPLYMSPEQTVGDKGLDGRTDLYSLGCVLYEMLAGNPPFGGRTVVHLVSQHAVDPAPRITESRAEVPPLLQDIILKCMAKRPEDRFGTARDLLDALAGASFVVTRDLAATAVRVGQSPSAVPTSVAVLPFVDLSQSRDQEYLCDGIAEEVMGALSKVGGLQVASRGSAFAYRGRQVDSRTVGQELGVGAVLEGSLQRIGDRLRVTARLSGTSDGFQIWSERYSREVTDVFAIQDEISTAIVDALRITFSGVSPVVVKRPTVNVEAYQLYLKGRHAWNRRYQGGLQKAMEYYREAIAIDPLYAPPYAGLADAFNTLASYDYMAPGEAFPRTISAARKALELDPSLAEAHTSLAWATAQFERKWDEALAGFRKAESLKPEYALTQVWHALVLSQLGRHDEAIRRITRALDLDPVDLPTSAIRGWIYYFARRYDEAESNLKATVTMDASFPASHGFLSMLYVSMGRYDEAVAEGEMAKVLPTVAPLVGIAHGLAGREKEARAILQKLEEASLVSPYGVSTVYLGLGEIDRAFEWLERGAEERAFQVNFAKVNPFYDGIREDPRFVRLLRTLNLS